MVWLKLGFAVKSCMDFSPHKCLRIPALLYSSVVCIVPATCLYSRTVTLLRSAQWRKFIGQVLKVSKSKIRQVEGGRGRFISYICTYCTFSISLVTTPFSCELSQFAPMPRIVFENKRTDHLRFEYRHTVYIYIYIFNR
jgi:hypothetical protein